MLQTANTVEYDSEHRCSKCGSYLRHKVQVFAGHLEIQVGCPHCGEIEQTITSLGWIAERIYERSLATDPLAKQLPLTRDSIARRHSN